MAKVKDEKLGAVLVIGKCKAGGKDWYSLFSNFTKLVHLLSIYCMQDIIRHIKR